MKCLCIIGPVGMHKTVFIRSPLFHVGSVDKLRLNSSVDLLAFLQCVGVCSRIT